MAIEHITVPDLGEASEVEVIELLVAVGDRVAENDSLLVLESDKAAMEIPAPMTGVVRTIAINLGDKVSTGSPMLSLEVEAAPATASDGASSPATTADTSAAEQVVEQNPEPDSGTKLEKAGAPEQADRQQTVADSAADHPAGTAGSVMQLVEIPDLGTNEEVDVIAVNVAVGDSIAVEDALITLESDKAAMDIPAPMAGVVEELLIRVGDRVRTGSAILRLQTRAAQAEVTAGETSAASRAASPAGVAPASAPAEVAPSSVTLPASAGSPMASQADTEQIRAVPMTQSSSLQSGQGKVYAGPAVRKLARELGVNLELVSGTGARGRITKDDVHEFVKSRINISATAALTGSVLPAAVPDVDFSRFGEVSHQERSKLQKVTATNMLRNWSAVPHVAQFNQADVTDLESFRADLKPEAERRGVKLTFMPFLLKACAKALEEYPQFNVSLHSSGQYVIQKKYCHIGMAVATEAGLVVPVIRDADRKSIWELAAEVIALSDKARARKLTPEEMQGACFTVSSLGSLGGTGFIPIINAPEVAILGVARSEIRPVFIDGEFLPRKILPVTLSYDHKVLNGVDGGQFADYLVRLLSDIRYLSL